MPALSTLQQVVEQLYCIPIVALRHCNFNYRKAEILHRKNFSTRTESACNIGKTIIFEINTQQQVAVSSDNTMALVANAVIRWPATFCSIHALRRETFRFTAHRQQHQTAEVLLKRQVSQTAAATDDFRGLPGEFPCLLNTDRGVDPIYEKVAKGFQTLNSDKPFRFEKNNGAVPQLQLAYETWGKPNADKSNGILLFSGLSASSHAKSQPDNKNAGWWENFIGPHYALDTDNFWIICANHIGGCFGSTGPSSINPINNQRYATNFPIMTITDMVRAQFMLCEHLGIQKLHAVVGSSVGGMCSVAAAILYPDRIGRMVSISATASTHPSAIAMRYVQRRSIMTDPNWNNGFYYDGAFPKQGMKLAREIATISYRSGPEWLERFGRKWIDGAEYNLCPTFEIERYLDYQGEKGAVLVDPNTFLYISKAADFFDVSDELYKIKCPSLVIGVQSDTLLPVWQQRDLATALRKSSECTYYELPSAYGHDTFLLDRHGVGVAVKGFLETELDFQLAEASAED